MQAIDCVAGSVGGCEDPMWDRWKNNLEEFKFEAHGKPNWLLDYPFTRFSMASSRALNSPIVYDEGS